MGIRDDATTILLAMLRHEQFPGDTKRGRYSYDGEELRRIVNLEIDALNDAVDILADSGDVEVIRAATSHPYSFICAELTPRGRAAAEELVTEDDSRAVETAAIAVGPPTAQKGWITRFLESEKEKRGVLWLVITAVVGLALAALALL